MHRRHLIAGFAAVACGIGTARRALPEASPKPLRLGLVHPVSPKGVPPLYVAFVDRLRELGYVEGDTLIVEYINLEGHLERYDEAMRELVRRRADLIYALGDVPRGVKPSHSHHLLPMLKDSDITSRGAFRQCRKAAGRGGGRPNLIEATKYCALFALT
jgi:hypothetical protein